MINITKLNNGVEMPLVGLGTYPMNGEQLNNVVSVCCDLGYRLFDSAHSYKNEKTLGVSLSSLSIDRSQLFITSKVKAYQYLGRRRYLHLDKKTISRCYADSLCELGLEYLDLYLLHSNIDYYMDAYEEMIQLYEAGKVKAIGVCSCTIEQLERFHAMYGIFPMVNQVEMHPYYNRLELVDFCQENNIQIQAYSPYAHGDYLQELLKNNTLLFLSRKYSKTIPQIILRWFVQRGIAVIPQSSNPTHLNENISIFDFELSLHEIQSINLLDRNESWGAHSGDYKRL